MNIRADYQNLVIVDANFLMVPVQYKINFLEELQFRLEGNTVFIIYKRVLDELEAKRRRADNRSRFRRELQASLSFLERFQEQYPITIKTSKRKKTQPIDDFLLERCKYLQETFNQKQIYLATNDYELRKKAREARVNRVYIKQKQYLRIERS
ncbi:MAG: PIN domain-containing protein [Promethearchaeia archaeon]